MKSKYGLVVGLIGLLCSCSSDPRREIRVAEFPADPWNAADAPADVYYNNTDTLGLKNLKTLVRFRSDFPADAAYRFVVETLTPDSLVWRDTLSVPPGRREITQTASLAYTDVRTDYRSQNRFDRSGVYRFRFIPLTEGYGREVLGIGLEIISQ